MKTKNRLYNPCGRCIEYDFCQSVRLPCERREKYIQQRRKRNDKIRAHIHAVMEAAKRNTYQ